MDKVEHGRRLREAMASRQETRAGVSEALNVAQRTVTNWTTGQTMPSDSQRALLRRLFPGYDDQGDPVEVAVLHSELTEDRQYFLLSTYKRLLREQVEGLRNV